MVRVFVVVIDVMMVAVAKNDDERIIQIAGRHRGQANPPNYTHSTKPCKPPHVHTTNQPTIPGGFRKSDGGWVKVGTGAACLLSPLECHCIFCCLMVRRIKSS